MKELYWVIKVDNYEDESYTLYFKNFDIAFQNYEKIKKEHQNDEDFEVCEQPNNANDAFYQCSWYDSRYNEYNTFITLTQKTMPKVWNKIVF